MKIKTTPSVIPTKAHRLVNYLLTTPTIHEDLQTLHNLALYDSGDAKLGPEEKQALFNAKQLYELFAEVKPEELRQLLPVD